MKKITVCVGSACHLKGSRAVVSLLKKSIEEKHLAEELLLEGTFCTGNCQKEGVCVVFDGVTYAVRPDTAAEFFEKTVLPALHAEASV